MCCGCRGRMRGTTRTVCMEWFCLLTSPACLIQVRWDSPTDHRGGKRKAGRNQEATKHVTSHTMLHHAILIHSQPNQTKTKWFVHYQSHLFCFFMNISLSINKISHLDMNHISQQKKKKKKEHKYSNVFRKRKEKNTTILKEKPELTE